MEFGDTIRAVDVAEGQVTIAYESLRNAGTGTTCRTGETPVAVTTEEFIAQSKTFLEVRKKCPRAKLLSRDAFDCSLGYRVRTGT